MEGVHDCGSSGVNTEGECILVNRGGGTRRVFISSSRPGGSNSFPEESSLKSSMADLERLMEQMRVEAMVRGAAWLQDTLEEAVRGTEPASSRGVTSDTRTRRSRPPERFSPEQRQPGTHSGPSAGPPPNRVASEREGRGRTEGGPNGGQRDVAGAAQRPSTARVERSVSPAPRVRESDVRSGARGEIPGPSGSTAGGRSRSERGRPGRAAIVPDGRTVVPNTGPGKVQQKTTGRWDTWRRGCTAAVSTATLVSRPGGHSSAEEEEGECIGEDERSGSEEEAPPPLQEDNSGGEQKSG